MGIRRLKPYNQDGFWYGLSPYNHDGFWYVLSSEWEVSYDRSISFFSANNRQGAKKWAIEIIQKKDNEKMKNALEYALLFSFFLFFFSSPFCGCVYLGAGG